MAWNLNPFLRNGYSHGVDARVISTQMDAGPDRKKRYSSDDTNKVSGSVFLPNAAAVQSWWAFWEGEANRGASWFDMPVVTMGVQVIHEVRIDYPNSEPRVVPYATGFRLTMTIETRERNTV